MPKVTNAFTTYNAVGNREDLSNTIYNIDPFDTPVMSAIRRRNVKNQTVRLADRISADCCAYCDVPGTGAMDPATERAVRRLCARAAAPPSRRSARTT